MSSIDFGVILLYFAALIVIGVIYYSRSSRGLDEYFLSGRNLPWWLAGVSMVATTFAADTPLAVTGIVAKNGIAGNWIWWGLAMSGFFTVFFYARLWRKAGVFTDAEFSEIRYSGKPASFLRGFRALYLAVPMNVVIMGWVTLGMAKVLGAALPEWDRWTIILVLYVITTLYLAASGLWGVVVADFLQFFIAIGGSILLAAYTIADFGGLENLKTAFIGAGYSEQMLSVNPFSAGYAEGLGLTVFVWLFVQWWSSWYPGAEPGGGGYIAQRMLSAKSEKDAVLSVLLFNILHYALRPWPWIITAVGAMVYFQGIGDPELGYPKTMLKLLPPGVFGLMVVAFLAAFMSTLSTHINWGASYLVSDLYKRFYRKDESEKEYILASRVFSIILMGLAILVAMGMESVKEGWEIILSVGAGTGPVYLLRWYWWRINAWSEISAMVGAMFGAVILPALVSKAVGKTVMAQNFPFLSADNFGLHLMWVTLFTSVAWLIVTFITKPETDQTLQEFCQKTGVRGPGWKKYISKEHGSAISIVTEFIFWVFAVGSTYGMLAGLSQIFFGHTIAGWCITIVSAGVIGFLFYKIFDKP